jgi:hypothetical protein
MSALNLIWCTAMVASFLFLVMATSGQGITYPAVSQTMMDNATNATTMSAENMTASSGNITDANMTQSAIYRVAVMNALET